MVNYKEMIHIIKSSHPNFERMTDEDEENDVSKAWAVTGKLVVERQAKIKVEFDGIIDDFIYSSFAFYIVDILIQDTSAASDLSYP